MDRIEIEDNAKQIIADLVSISVRDIQNDSCFVSDLHFDSLDAVELTMMLEDEFNIDITDEEAESLMTFKTLVDFLEKRVTN